MDGHGGLLIAGIERLAFSDGVQPLRAYITNIGEDGNENWRSEIPSFQYARATTLEVTSDGKIWVGGETDLPNPPFTMSFVAEYASDGTLLRNHLFNIGSIIDLAITDSGKILAMAGGALIQISSAGDEEWSASIANATPSFDGSLAISNDDVFVVGTVLGLDEDKRVTSFGVVEKLGLNVPEPMSNAPAATAVLIAAKATRRRRTFRQ